MKKLWEITNSQKFKYSTNKKNMIFEEFSW